MSSANKSNNAVLALSLLPSFVKLFEALFGKGTGPQKKTAVTQVVTSLIVAGGSAVAANNPNYGTAIGELIDSTVSHLNGTGEMPTPVVAP